MFIRQEISSCAVPPDVAWRSLVERSIQAWGSLQFVMKGCIRTEKWAGQWLRHWQSLDEFLDRTPDSLMFWFFQRREDFLAQDEMRKWSSDALDSYVLLPALKGFVSREDCFFVSHYWRHRNHPDPDGKYLRLFQGELGSQHWSYIWVDWTCTPQHPRSRVEDKYFVRSLETVSALIRNCGFIWFYPPFEARMWILYEIAEYALTADEGVTSTEDMRKFIGHVHEMVGNGVRPVLEKYNYRCTEALDKAFLISWLELLVLLKKLGFDVAIIRRLLDSLTWQPNVQSSRFTLGGACLELQKFEGRLILRDEVWTFTPFPSWGNHRPLPIPS